MGQAVGFSVCYDAVIDELKSYFSGTIRPDAIGKDLFTITTYVYDEGLEYGIWVEFGGGEPEILPPMRKHMWIWTIDGVLIIRYTGNDLTMEETLGDRIDQLFRAFATPNHAIDGITPLVKIAWIGKPDAVSVEDTPFYFLPFTIKLIDDRGG